MNFQVIIFEGHGPIVTSGRSQEVDKFKKRFGLAYNHPHESHFFSTIEEATVFANAKATVQKHVEQINTIQDGTTDNDSQPVASTSTRDKRRSYTKLSDLPDDTASDESGL